jgi:3-carboxy-cis,cis-muconate cycloisomerase
VSGSNDLRDVLASDAKVTAHLSADRLTKLFEPMAYQGASQALIDRLLTALDEK